MTLARIRRFLCVAEISLGFAAVYACSLNPQPLPPGETAEGGQTKLGADSGAGHTGDDAGDFGGADATNGADAVTAAPADAGADTGAGGGPGDGAGDGGEGDAPLDGPADATDAGAGDAPSDGEEGGG